jgi:transcription antitermination factor NusG
MEGEEAHWYAFRVPAQKWRSARSAMEDEGFEVFVPIKQWWRRRTRHSRKMTGVWSPVMPGYIFMRFESGPPWHLIFRHTLVRSVVGFSGVPARIRNSCMMRIQAEYFAPDEERKVAAGDEVRVTRGLLEGRRIKVTSVKGRTARAMLEFFNTSKEVELPLDALEPI